MDGIPTGPPGPASATNATFTPNGQTLLMNQGDKLKITIKDTPNGMINQINDMSTGQSGFMVASASNGFQSLNVNTCAPTNFSFHPEYSTAKFGNFVPWAALQANVGFASEIGHFTPGVNGDGDADDAPCFSGPTLPGCLNLAQGGDIDFDGTSYLADWPDGTTNNATSLQISSVSGNGFGPLSAPRGSSSYTNGYPAFQFETDVLASESTCNPDGSAALYLLRARSSTHSMPSQVRERAAISLSVMIFVEPPLTISGVTHSMAPRISHGSSVPPVVEFDPIPALRMRS